MSRPNLYDYLKICALCTMIVDHIGFFLYPENEWLRVIGRLSFPLFLLLVGYNQSYRWRRNIAILGLVLQGCIRYAYSLGYHISPSINILLMIVCARIYLSYVTFLHPVIQLIAGVMSLILMPMTFPYFSYGTGAFLFGLLGHHLYHRTIHWKMILGCAYLVFAYHIGLMIRYHHFAPHTWFLLLGIYVSLCSVATILLACGNTSIQISHRLDPILIFVSRHALWIYILHGILLAYLAWQ